MAKHHDTGTLGESLACDYLITKGFSILQKNWRHKHWEVDIIASREERLHFIEIKTRRSAIFGHPEDAVSRKKLRNLIDAAEIFLLQNKEWKKIRFDILSITLAKGREAGYFFIEDVYL